MNKPLAVMQEEVRINNIEKGWYDKPVSFPEAIALLHSEVSEALEAWRSFDLDDATPTFPLLDEMFPGAIPKPEGVGSEFADVLIRLLDYCERFGINLEAEYERKMAFNRKRPYRHGGKAI